MSENCVNNVTIYLYFFSSPFLLFCGCAEEGICVGGGFLNVPPVCSLHLAIMRKAEPPLRRRLSRKKI